MEQMGQAFFLACILIYVILAAQFRSYLQPLVVMCVIAVSWIGVTLGMTTWGYALSLYVICSMVGLAGIVGNDSLILIDFNNKQREAGVAIKDAVQTAASRRFRAILLATLTTVGYGDIYPVTPGEQIFTFIILMIGLGIVAVPAGLIATALSQILRTEEDGGATR